MVPGSTPPAQNIGSWNTGIGRGVRPSVTADSRTHPQNARSRNALDGPHICLYRIPRPEDLVEKRGSKFFIVIRGQDVGIYTAWLQVDVRVRGLKGVSPIFESRLTWAEAVDTYRAAFYDGTIDICPTPHGQFDRPAGFLPSTDGRCGHGILNGMPKKHRSAYIPDPEELKKFNSSKYYVVIRGEEVGIYRSWHEAIVRTETVNRGRSYLKNTWDEALELYTDTYYGKKLKVLPRLSASLTATNHWDHDLVGNGPDENELDNTGSNDDTASALLTCAHGLHI
ncbi:hypothetical protein NLJ89_g11332 [Agrocybe chaxingu]|uniref:Ribonuclease H1 N-terminal domain-containing protein n=1 Tax=Agrocybe chaxingu TaxID=84603 RepID=A0A9W8JM33_9AGAR|nr:hypothetical protein NLJ89_g11332 [Agrocybe chaxingu]